MRLVVLLRVWWPWLRTLLPVFLAPVLANSVGAQEVTPHDSRLLVLDVGYQAVVPQNLLITELGSTETLTTLLTGFDGAAGFYQSKQEALGGCGPAEVERSTVWRIGLFGRNRPVVSAEGGPSRRPSVSRSEIHANMEAATGGQPVLLP